MSNVHDTLAVLKVLVQADAHISAKDIAARTPAFGSVLSPGSVAGMLLCMPDDLDIRIEGRLESGVKMYALTPDARAHFAGNTDNKFLCEIRDLFPPPMRGMPVHADVIVLAVGSLIEASKQHDAYVRANDCNLKNLAACQELLGKAETALNCFAADIPAVVARMKAEVEARPTNAWLWSMAELIRDAVGQEVIPRSEVVTDQHVKDHLQQAFVAVQGYVGKVRDQRDATADLGAKLKQALKDANKADADAAQAATRATQAEGQVNLLLQAMRWMWKDGHHPTLSQAFDMLVFQSQLYFVLNHALDAVGVQKGEPAALRALFALGQLSEARHNATPATAPQP